MTAYGGPTAGALKQAHHVTAQCPTGTSSTTPVNSGDLFVLGATDQEGTHYRLAAAADNNAANTVTLVQALAYSEDATGDVPVEILGPGVGVVRLPYRAATGTPTVGQSVEIDANDLRKVNGKTFAAGAGKILAVLTASTEVEVVF